MGKTPKKKEGNKEGKEKGEERGEGKRDNKKKEEGFVGRVRSGGERKEEMDEFAQKKMRGRKKDQEELQQKLHLVFFFLSLLLFLLSLKSKLILTQTKQKFRGENVNLSRNPSDISQFVLAIQDVFISFHFISYSFISFPFFPPSI